VVPTSRKHANSLNTRTLVANISANLNGVYVSLRITAAVVSKGFVIGYAFDSTSPTTMV